MSQPANSVRISLSRAEIRLIRVGLNRIHQAHRFWEATGKMPYAHPRAIFNEAGFERGTYSSEQMQIIQSNLDKLQAVAGRSGRLEVDAFEIAAFMLGVRVTKTMLRHGHIQAWRPDGQAACQKLERRLENDRKRAKRALVPGCGRAAFADASRQWKRFVHWVRVHLLYCPCGRTKYRGIGRIRRLRTAEQVSMYKQRLQRELPRHNYVVPPPPEFEKLVKQARRKARRWMRRRKKRGLPIEADEVWRRIWHHVTDHCEQDITPYERLMKAMGR
jgi:hypothetical protein